MNLNQDNLETRYAVILWLDGMSEARAFLWLKKRDWDHQGAEQASESN